MPDQTIGSAHRRQTGVKSIVPSQVVDHLAGHGGPPMQQLAGHPPAGGSDLCRHGVRPESACGEPSWDSPVSGGARRFNSLLFDGSSKEIVGSMTVSVARRHAARSSVDSSSTAAASASCALAKAVRAAAASRAGLAAAAASSWSVASTSDNSVVATRTPRAPVSWQRWWCRSSHRRSRRRGRQW
jgi:hypothetical protein